MAKRRAIIPSWVETVGASIDQGGVRILALCSACKGEREVDLEALAQLKGPAYSLVNRRCPCRMTPGCKGWNRFHYSGGRGTPLRPLWDDATDLRWISGPRFSERP